MAKKHAPDIDVTRELIPSIVDYLAKVKPHTLYAEYPVSPLTYEEGYHKVNYGDFANAINGLAWWLYDNLGLGQNHEVLAYIGPNDVRYPALVLGAVKAGYTLFLTSPRNSIAAQTSLFNHLKCKTMLSPSPRPPPVAAILEVVELRLLDIPSVDDLLDKKHTHFTYARPFDEALQDPLWVIHTSGSTGIPKPLVFTHETAARMITMISRDPPPGLKSLDKLTQGKRMFMTFPPFHGASLATLLFNAIPFGTVVIAPVSGAIPSASGMVEGLKQTSADLGMIVPSIVQELSQRPDLLDYCARNLEMILYCGGDLPQSIGDVVASQIKLVNQFGASELGIMPLLLSEDRAQGDWKYAQFHPDLGYQFRHVTGNEYELCVVLDSKLKETQPTFTIFPNTNEYCSRDLFVPHPSKPDLWAWHARADDIIVFLNGEKHNPISVEQYIVSHNPQVSACLVIGAQRFQAALLVEVATDKEEISVSERAAYIEKLWPSIEETNQDAPTHARIAKSHILLAHPQRPMMRAGKGTIQRAGTVGLYAKEIDALYDTADLMSGGLEGVSLTSLDDMPSLLTSIKESIVLAINTSYIGDNDNFFTIGMDSLQALTLVRKLRQSLGMPMIELNVIYTNPSAAELTNAIVRLSKHHQDSQASKERTRHDIRSKILKEYTDMIDRIPQHSKFTKDVHGHNVILTGSTGALGSYILNALQIKPTTTHIYCLNRATDSAALQVERNKLYGLPTTVDHSRVTFLTTDLSQDNFGLQPDVYNILRDTSTLVIHCAWPVNFNLSLTSFRPQLDGLVNFIRFTTSAACSPHFHFISSIASVLSYHNPSLQTPEDVVSVESFANGYGESKYVSERLLDYAAMRLPVSCSFSRVGQIAGAVNYAGLWNKAEWFPSLVISSLHVGTVPSSLGSLDPINWVPIDLLSEILVELILDKHESRLEPGMEIRGQINVYHPLNPQFTTWELVKKILVDELSSLTGKALKTAPLRQWLHNVRRAMELTANNQPDSKNIDFAPILQANPAVRLLDFYEQVLGLDEDSVNQLEIAKTKELSKTLGALEGINADWIKKWVREWIE